MDEKAASTETEKPKSSKCEPKAKWAPKKAPTKSKKAAAPEKAKKGAGSAKKMEVDEAKDEEVPMDGCTPPRKYRRSSRAAPPTSYRRRRRVLPVPQRGCRRGC